MIALLDSDDAWMPNFLSSLVNVLEACPDVGMVYCDSMVFNPKGDHFHTFTFEPYRYDILLNSTGMIPTGSFLFRTECARQIDNFRTDIWRGEDFEWLIRFGELFKMKRHPEIKMEFNPQQ